MDVETFVGQLLRSIERQPREWAKAKHSDDLENFKAGVSIRVPRAGFWEAKRPAQVRILSSATVLCEVNRDAAALAIARRADTFERERDLKKRTIHEARVADFFETFPGFF